MARKILISALVFSLLTAEGYPGRDLLIPAGVYESGIQSELSCRLAGRSEQLRLIIENFKNFHPDGDESLIAAAYQTARRIYTGISFGPGESYIGHVSDVALAVSRWGGNLESICAALLHKVKDTDKRSARRALGGTEFTAAQKAAVEGHINRLENITELPYVDGSYIKSLSGKYTLLYFQEMLARLAQNPDTMLLVFADRLYSISKGSNLSERLYRYQEIMHIYAPMADRLFSNMIFEDMRDGALKLMAPEVYDEIKSMVESVYGMGYEAMMNNLERAVSEIESSIESFELDDIKIEYRLKSIYSVFEKVTSGRRKDLGPIAPLADVMHNFSGHKKNIKENISKLNDLAGIRLVTNKTGGSVRLIESLFGGSDGYAQKQRHIGSKDVKFNFKYSGKLPFEVVVVEPDEHIKYFYGYHEDDPYALGVPHWMYKLGCNKNTVDLQTGSYGAKIKLYDGKIEVEQWFKPDLIRFGMDFRENFNSFHRIVSGWKYVAYIKSNSDVVILKIRKDASPADAAAHNEIDELERAYFLMGGLAAVDLKFEGSWAERQLIPLDENASALRNGMVVKRRNAREGNLLAEAVSNCVCPRTKLLCQGLDKKGIKHYRGDGMEIIGKAHGRSFKYGGRLAGWLYRISWFYGINIPSEVKNKLKRFAAKKYLHSPGELYAAVGCGIISIEEVGKFLRSKEAYLLEIKGGRPPENYAEGWLRNVVEENKLAISTFEYYYGKSGFKIKCVVEDRDVADPAGVSQMISSIKSVFGEKNVAWGSIKNLRDKESRLISELEASL